ncbi:hypothetical protein [Dactylosporangium sp. CA-092794]|uniref:hypothetical protein n=1 Tax=Dactylosporangium sp. CA-092794 TaxID=3239929 RepID=UPI003D89DD80
MAASWAASHPGYEQRCPDTTTPVDINPAKISLTLKAVRTDQSAGGNLTCHGDVQAGMRMRRAIIVGVVVAVVVSAVTVAVIAAARPEPACGCSVKPDLRRPAHDAAVRFEALLRRADVSGAWALLTDGARARYVDVAGFRPVFDRLGTALHEADADAGGDRATAGWLAVDDRVRYDRPSEVVVVRYLTGPPRLAWPLLILVPLGHAGDERIDPEPPTLRLTAISDGDGVRVEVPDGDLRLTSFVVIDSAGQDTLPSREHVTEDADRLSWRTPLRGPVVVIAVEKSGTSLRVGAAAATLG